MNNLLNKNMPPDDIIYADFSNCAHDGEPKSEHDIDDMIFSALPEIKIYSER